MGVCLCVACADSDDKERWVMKDGTVLYVEPEVRQYATEQEFVDEMAAGYMRRSGGRENPVPVDVEPDSMYGAKEIRMKAWEKAGSVHGRKNSDWQQIRCTLSVRLRR